MSTSLILENVSCAGCVRKIENKLKDVPDINQAEVNFPLRRLTFDGDTSTEAVIEALSEIGFRARISKSDSEERIKKKAQDEQEYKSHLRNALLALSLGIPMMLMMLVMDDMSISTAGDQLFWGVIGILTAAVMYKTGLHFFTGASRFVKGGSATMDTLVALGTGSAWIFSMFIVAFPDFFPEQARHIYFEASVMIIGLVNFGQAMEIRARSSSSAAIERLMDLRPQTVTLTRNGKEQTLPLELVEIGDLIRIKPGDQIPIDGIVIEGSSYIDESMLTGEPLPVSKSVDSLVSGGTLNQQGTLLIRAEKVGEETALSKIIELIKEAQNSKPEIARLADNVSAIFVPVVIGISVLTALLWLLFGPEPPVAYMLVTSVTVLIIACPCALGLATPMSVMMGIGKAAEYGILVKNADALQSSAHIDTLLLDKTGTITEGKPALTDIISFNIKEQDLLQLAASVEQYSEHPLGSAIVNKATLSDISLLSMEGFSAVIGQGVSATLGSDIITIGNAEMMLATGVDLSDTDNQTSQLNKTSTKLYVARNQELIGILGVSDPIRPDAREAIERIQSLGTKVVMITGDHRNTAMEVALAVGVDDYIAEVMPDQKSDKVKELQGSGQSIVAMAGDGINDAPALTQANVGFAIGNGTDIAIESADVVLTRNSLHSIADAIELSRATISNIKQNLFGAFIYNSLGIPVAAGILYPFTGVLLSPIIAGGAMALSSATVVSNANRLRFAKIGK